MPSVKSATEGEISAGRVRPVVRLVSAPSVSPVIAFAFAQQQHHGGRHIDNLRNIKKGRFSSTGIGDAATSRSSIATFFIPRPSASSLLGLKEMSPDDARFAEATECTSPVKSATAEERAIVQRGRDQTAAAHKSGDVAEAQALSNAASAHKTVLDENDAMFELVCRCPKDAEACEKIMLDDLALIRAGEWRELKLVLTGRLVDYHQEMDEDARRSQRPVRPRVVAVERERVGAAEALDRTAHSSARNRQMPSHTLGKGAARAGAGLGNSVRSTT